MNKTVLILGGSSGIGLSTAEYLHDIGYEVYIASRNRPKECKLNFLKVDITNESSVKDLFHYFMKNQIDIYGLVYSIGITKQKAHIKDFSIDIFNKIIATNVTGTLLSLKYAYDFLKKTQGRVVIINSLASRTFSQFSGIEYTMSKAALSGLVKQLSQECLSDKILVNSIYPSMTKTNMLTETLSKEELESLSNTLPLKKILEPHEIAKSVEFLLNPEITYITGSAIDINGGLFLNG
jgi:3-oxoacyl-[acyl-carrier protein] reductase